MLKKHHIIGRHNRPWGVLLASWVPLEKAVEKSIEKAVWITFSTARCAWIWWIASCSAKLGQWLKTEKCGVSNGHCGGGESLKGMLNKPRYVTSSSLLTPWYVSWSPKTLLQKRENTTGHWPCLLHLCHLEGAAGKWSTYTSFFWRLMQGGDDQHEWDLFVSLFRWFVSGVWSSRFIHSAVDLKCQSDNAVNGHFWTLKFEHTA